MATSEALKGNTQFVMMEKKCNCLDAQLELPSLTSDWHKIILADRTELFLFQFNQTVRQVCSTDATLGPTIDQKQALIQLFLISFVN